MQIPVQPSQAAQSVDEERFGAMCHLAAGLAHDFNNVLTVLSGYAQMLDDALARGAPSAQLAIYVSELRGATERGSHLTDQLLAFCSRSKMQARRFDLIDMVNGMRESIESVVGPRIEVVVEAGREAGFVLADRGLLERVFLNLAQVARDAMPQQGRFEIAARNEDSRVVVDCGYAGEGASVPAKDRAFEPYSASQPKGRVMALGLSVVYGIVKQSHGHVAVRSEPGYGAAFHMSFPVASEEQAATTAKRTSGVATLREARGDTTVLLVEDDETVRMLVKRMLERCGYHALVASGADEALRLWRNHDGHIHLLLTDIVMPETGGRELAKALRRCSPALKILYMSGFFEETGVQGAPDAGTLLIRKPFTPDSLAEYVRRALDAPPSTL